MKLAKLKPILSIYQLCTLSFGVCLEQEPDHVALNIISISNLALTKTTWRSGLVLGSGVLAQWSALYILEIRTRFLELYHK